MNIYTKMLQTIYTSISNSNLGGQIIFHYFHDITSVRVKRHILLFCFLMPRGLLKIVTRANEELTRESKFSGAKLNSRNLNYDI